MKKIIKVEVEFEGDANVDFKARILEKINEIPFHSPECDYEYIGIIRKLNMEEENV